MNSGVQETGAADGRGDRDPGPPAPPEAPRRGGLRRLAAGLAALALLVALVPGFLLLALHTGTGRRAIEHYTARLTSGQVQISGLGGGLEDLVLGTLTLRDARGAWLEGRDLRLRWSPWALIVRRVRIDTLAAGRLDLERLPLPGKPQRRRSSTSFSLPRIEARSVAIERLEFGPELTGTRAVFALRASGALGPTDPLASAPLEAHVQVLQTNGPGRYILDVTTTRGRIDAHALLSDPAGGPLSTLAGLPGLGATKARAELHGPRHEAALMLHVDAGALAARAQGALDLDHVGARLDFSAQAPAMQPAPDIGWDGVSLDGRWQGDLQHAQAQLQLAIDQLRLAAGLHVGRLQARVAASSGDANLTARIDGLELPGAAGGLFAAAPLELAGQARLADHHRPWQLRARHPIADVDAQGTFAPQALSLQMRARDLAPLARLAGEELAGPGELHASLTRKGGKIAGDLSGTAALGGSSLAARLLGSAARIAARGSWHEARERLQLSSLELTGQALALRASGHLDLPQDATARRASAQVALDLSKLERLTPTLRGSLRLDGRLDGPLDQLAATARARLRALSLHDSPPGDLDLVAEAHGLPAHSSGRVEVRGMLDAAPLRLVAAVERLPGGIARLHVEQSHWKSLEAQADLRSAPRWRGARGRALVHVGNLADLSRLLGVPLEGSLDARLSAQASGQGTRASVRLDTAALRIDAQPGELHLSGSGPLEDLALVVDARSPDVGGDPASLALRARVDLETRRVALDAASALVHEERLQLLAPAHIDTADGLAIDELRLGAGHAELRVGGRLSPQLDVHGSLQNLDAGVLEAVLPDVMDEGRIDASVELAGTLARPAGTARVTLQGLRLAADEDDALPPIDATARADLVSTIAAVDVRATAGRGSALHVQGHVPLEPSAGELAVAVGGTLSASLANPLLEAQGRRAAGSLQLDLRVAGTMAAPRLEGAAQLSGGDFRDYPQGVHVGSLSGRLVAAGTRLQLAGVTGRAGGGQLLASGWIGVLEPRLPVELQLRARSAQPINSDLLTATVDGDLALRGEIAGALDVSGRIDVRRALINIPNALPPNVAVLDVRRRGKAAPGAEAPRRIVRLDLKVDAPRQVLVRGRGLDAELGGSLTLGGTLGAVQVGGGFELIRGSFTLASSQLQFSRGEVSFNGTGLEERIDPTLDFAAQSQVADTTVTVNITGLADDPRFELTSTPTLPPDEILARLLFGQPAAQLSALQVAQIGAALASMSGVGGGSGPGFNPLDRLQKALGLDRLSVGGAGNANGNAPGSGGDTGFGASVTAGRYVSSRVFVAATQTTTGTSQLQVDVDLAKGLKLRTRLGNGTATAQGTTPENDPGSSIGLSWQFEY